MMEFSNYIARSPRIKSTANSDERRYPRWSNVGSSEVGDAKLVWAAFPRGFECSGDRLHFRCFLLRRETQPKPEQRTWIAPIFLQILTENFFGFFRMVAAQERRAKRFTQGVIPIRRLVVIHFVLHGDGCSPMFDRVGPLAVRFRDARLERICGQIVECAPVVVQHSKSHARREFLISRFRRPMLHFGFGGLSFCSERATARVIPEKRKAFQFWVRFWQRQH